MKEYYLIRKELLDKVKRVLDLRDLVKITASNYKKTRKIINKYAKQSKKESDTKKLFKKQQVEEEMIETRYLHSVIGLMEIVYKILYTDSFEKDLPALEKWYEFEMEDMILVNGLVKGLKYYNSLDVTEDDVIGALNFAVEQYVECIENNTEYADIFDKSFPFVQLTILTEKQRMKLPKLDDLFTSQAQRDYENAEINKRLTISYKYRALIQDEIQHTNKLSLK